MFSSLRSRLWWSYALVTLAALSVVAVVLFIYIIQNPSTYRQASARLTVVAALLRKNEASLANFTPTELQARIEQVGNTYDTRIVLFNRKRQTIADSQAAQQNPLQMPVLPRLRAASVLRDQKGQNWLYIIQHLGNGDWLLVAVPRPAVPLLTVLSDELMLPILGAAVVALIISLFVAFWLARWIGDPLQRVVVASRKLPSAAAKPVTPHGPQEVQELTRAFNEMNTRVLVSQKSQREFVANVSHELKTPLTSVQGFAQAILDGTASTPESHQQAARVIYDEAGRMHRMVLDLLDLARLDAGTLDLQRTPVDLPALLNTITEKFTPQARAAGVVISMEAAVLPTITGDGDRLAQVFTNLVDNALKNTPTGGQIRLRAVQSGSEVQVDVVDTGAGIPPEALSHIFERFYQADPSRPGGEKHGTGLGLAIVKEIVGAHGGTISVRSAPGPALPAPVPQAQVSGNEGSGSTFTVTLPLTMPEAVTIVSKHKK
jgi:two-component system, OmpR family, sensor kinase